MQPIDHTSTVAISLRSHEKSGCIDSLAVVYRLFDNMISGALYHLVATSTAVSADRLVVKLER